MVPSGLNLSYETTTPVTVYFHHVEPPPMASILQFFEANFHQTGFQAYEFVIRNLPTGERVVSFKVNAAVEQLPALLSLTVEEIALRYTKSQTNEWTVDYHLTMKGEGDRIIVSEATSAKKIGIPKQAMENLYTKCWKDKLALMIIIEHLSKINEEIYINIDGLLKTMNNLGLFPRNEFLINLTFVLMKESNGSGLISLNNFSGILARFGPIIHMRRKMDSFVMSKTSASYYGSITADKAAGILNEFYNNFKVPACLYRNTIPNYTKGEPILPVFSVSWIVNGGVQHLRIHVDTHGNLCFKESTENNVIHAKRINLWSDIMSKIKEVNRLPPDMAFQPVVTNEYSQLKAEEYIDIRQKPKRDFPYENDLHDVDNDTTFFGFVDTL